MKWKYFCEPQSGKLVPQLSKGITFAYDLHLGHSINDWKGPTNMQNSVNGLHDSFTYGVP